MDKITDIFAKKQRTFSYEFYPPKTDKGHENLFHAAETFDKLDADFFSVTYGAGGTGSKKTLDLVEQLLDRFNVPVMHHLTCVKHTFDEIREQLEAMKQAGVRNIMALRGDPPPNEEFIPAPDRPHYGFELIKIIREHGDWFDIGVPGFPEVHPLSPSEDVDTMILRIKAESGANFVITQLFFDNEMYYRFRDRVEKEGVKMRLIPGILPITNYDRLVQFCEMCGTSIPREVIEQFAPLREDGDGTREAGIELAARQCQDLLDNGAPGIHFYCLNKAEPAATIRQNIQVPAGA